MDSRLEAITEQRSAAKSGPGPIARELYQKFNEAIHRQERSNYRLPNRIRITGTAAENPAIVACAAAWHEEYQRLIDDDDSDTSHARSEANAAWLTALPPLYGAENIQSFIACVAYGLATGILSPEKGSRLLYAAQVALGAQGHHNHRPAGRPAKTPPSQHNEPATAETLPASEPDSGQKC